MWQPLHPPIHAVAIFRRSIVFYFPGINDNESSSRVRSFHFGHGGAAVEEGAGGAGLHAFAAGGAGFGLAPGLVEIGDDAATGAASGDVLGAGSLDVPADPRTHRVQSTQRLWSMPNERWVMST